MEKHAIEIGLPETPPKAGAKQLSRALREVDRALSGKTRFEVKRRKLTTRALGVQPDVIVMTLTTGVQLASALVGLRAAMISLHRSRQQKATPQHIEVAGKDRVVRIPLDATQSQIELGLGGLEPKDVVRIAFKTT